MKTYYNINYFLIFTTLLLSTLSCIPQKAVKKPYIGEESDSKVENPGTIVDSSQQMTTLEFVQSCQNISDLRSCPSSEIHLQKVVLIRDRLSAVYYDYGVASNISQLTRMSLSVYRGSFDHSYNLSYAYSEIFESFRPSINPLFMEKISRYPTALEIQNIRTLFVLEQKKKIEIIQYILSLGNTSTDAASDNDSRCSQIEESCAIIGGVGKREIICADGQFVSYGACVAVSCDQLSSYQLIGGKCVLSTSSSEPLNNEILAAQQFLNNFKNHWGITISSQGFKSLTQDMANGFLSEYTARNQLAMTSEMQILIRNLFYIYQEGRTPSATEINAVVGKITMGESKDAIISYISQLTPSNESTNSEGSSSKQCTLNGITYSQGDIRCNGAKKIMCQGSLFVRVSTCELGHQCYNEPILSNGSYTTSCHPMYITKSGAELISMGFSDKQGVGIYRGAFNSNTGQYSNWQLQSCANGYIIVNSSCELESSAPSPDNQCEAASGYLVTTDDTNSCHFSWPAAPIGQIFNSGNGLVAPEDGGGYVTCVLHNGIAAWNTSGLFCNNIDGTGSNDDNSKCSEVAKIDIMSKDRSKVCTFSWPSGNQHQIFSFPSIDGSGASVNNGGTGSVTCLRPGEFNNEWDTTRLSCPNAISTTCEGGEALVKSTDGQNTCTFTWNSAAVGDSVTKENGGFSADNGGYGSATCSTSPADGSPQWRYNYLCPNNDTLSCPGGQEIVKSPDQSNSCIFTWGSATVGDSVTKENEGFTATGGGYGSATCSTSPADGSPQWRYNYLCPNNETLACPGGQEIVKSPDNSNSCIFTWDSATVGNSITKENRGLTATGGGFGSATCSISPTDGTPTWTFGYLCPNSGSLACAGGQQIIDSQDGSNQCLFNFAQKNVGESQEVVSTNGGFVNGTCIKESDTSAVWNYQAHCPNSNGAITCRAGVNLVASSSGGESCSCKWPSIPAGEGYDNSCSNGGSISGLCKSDGTWSNITITCP